MYTQFFNKIKYLKLHTIVVYSYKTIGIAPFRKRSKIGPIVREYT